MPGFARDATGQATLGGVPLERALREAGVPTPVYAYDVDGIAENARDLVSALGPRPGFAAYAVKANSAGTILRALREAGCGADVVSGGELALALAAGVEPSRIVMSGVAKRDDEIDAALANGIFALQLESPEELARVGSRARQLRVKARVSLRLNPHVAIDSHSHIATGHDKAKFGIPVAQVGAVLSALDADTAVELVGLSTHVGSMLSRTDPYVASARVVCDVARARLSAGKRLEYVDFGGGFGIDYGAGAAARPSDFVRAARGLLDEAGLAGLQLVVEPGRSLVGPFGVVVASVIQKKGDAGSGWVLIDAAMNDLIRPALYGARHRIEPLERPPSEPSWRVAGPVCESSDVFGEHPLGPAPPAHVVIRDAGAYGFVMASEYNGRALASEVFLSSGRVAHVSRSPGADAWVAARMRA